MEPAAILDRRFVLEAEHKRGGMGTVWRGKDLTSAKQVAVKILHAGEAVEAERFAREAALLANLSHAGIVSYVANGTTESGVPYLVMEWLDGENVAERLARRPLTLSETLTLLRSAAGALAAVHAAGIVHRDLKPSNLFLRQHRVDDVVILDLGIARSASASRDLTRTGAVLGTPSYMSPEQAQGHTKIGAAADVFSLGCLLFECLIGRPPFAGAQLFTILAKIVFESAPRLTELRPELPARLETFVDQLLAKDPAQRLADARAVLAALADLGSMPDLEAPSTVAPARPAPSEQELVSVVIAMPGAGATLAGENTEVNVDFSIYGGEARQLVDGTTVVTLGQRGGAATDLARRAARCALRAREGRPHARIALATGRGVPSERFHVGEAVDRASALLRRHADVAPGMICLDDVTAGLLDARFRTRALTGGAFVLEAEEPSVDPSRPLLGRPTACVGRDRDLATLELALRTAIEDSAPCAVLVVAPPGIGKSRLRHELLRRIESQGEEMLILFAQGDPIRSASTLGLLGAALSRLCGLRSDASDEENRAAFEKRIGRNAPEQALRTTVFLGEMCGLRWPAETVPELRASRHNPRIMSEQISEAWVDFLKAEARVRPVLLALDDLQWSDALTVNLVDAALRELSNSPLLVLAFARPEVQGIFPDLWARRLTVLPLRPLSAAVAGKFVRNMLDEGTSEDAVDRIVARAAGNALYLEELIRAAAAKREEVPETVLAMLQSRIGLLASFSRRVLRAASVFGETFTAAGVRALLTSADSTPGELAAALAGLSRDEILEAQGGDRWRFRHVLMRDAAYSLFTPEDRQASHALAAQVLEASGDDPAVVASHFERGGDHTNAIRLYTTAALVAVRRYDHLGSLALVRRGLALDPTGEYRGVLRSVEAELLNLAYEFVNAWEASTEAMALLPRGHPRHTRSISTNVYSGLLLGKTEETQQRTRELLATEPSEEGRGEYVTGLGWASITHTARGDRAPASEMLARAAVLEARVDEGDAFVHGTARYWESRFAELLGEDVYTTWSLATESVRLCRISGDRGMLASALGTLGDASRRLGSFAEAEAQLREGVELAQRRKDDPTVRDFLRQYLANFLAARGSEEDLAEARALGNVVLQDAKNTSPYYAMGCFALAEAALKTGDLAAAETYAQQARSTMSALMMSGYFPHGDAVLLRVYTAARNPAAGELADRSLLQLEQLGPMGLMDLPLRLSIANAYRMLNQSEDAARVVRQAAVRLDASAAAIPDAAMRERFLLRVPENVELRRLAEAL